MLSGRLLRRKKTNLAQALADSTTLYAPATYPIPYGANGLLVGGKGGEGIAATGGNYAGGGNAYTNPTYMFGTSYTDYYDNTNGWHDYGYGDDPWGPSTRKPARRTYTANPGFPGYSVVNYNVDGYTPGYTDYNPTYYNPYYAGANGATATVGGVTLPGGTRNAPTAPTVAPTVSNLKYQTAGISVTVPSGGYVTLTPIG
jgi:hypothetical protein